MLVEYNRTTDQSGGNAYTSSVRRTPRVRSLRTWRTRFAMGQTPVLVDVGTRVPTVPVDVAAHDVAVHGPEGAEAASGHG